MIKKRIFLTVTNDLNYDQRMIRICSSLSDAGYDVTLVGWRWPSSLPLVPRSYKQQRLALPLTQGKAMYLLYWARLFRYLLGQKPDAICAIDLDTLLPVHAACMATGALRVHDAHEIFTEMKEVNARPAIKRIWEMLAQKLLPKFPNGYTIGAAYAQFFREKYGVSYAIVRNATVLEAFEIPIKNEKYILYQGAVNEGRCFEELIPAMEHVAATLLIVGKGNFSRQAQKLIEQYRLEDKIKMLGYRRPEELKKYTENAYIGITLFDTNNDEHSNQLSMANRFFDYIHHGVPQLCNDYPEYRNVQEQYGIGILLPDVSVGSIAEALNILLKDEQLYQKLSAGAMEARQKYCWQHEEQRLLAVWQNIWAHDQL